MNPKCRSGTYQIEEYHELLQEIVCRSPNPTEAVQQHLQKQLDTSVLDALSPVMHLASQKISDNIMALHEQVLENRAIHVAEDPGLHLVWHSDAIYIKPIPHIFLHERFWSEHFGADASTAAPFKTLYPKAVGFMRTYTYLIRHYSDFVIAKDVLLLPKELSFTDFQTILRPFRNVPDDKVSRRYHYGQISLTRLNVLTFFLGPKYLHQFRWSYFYDHRNTSHYAKSVGIVLAFCWVAVMVILRAMQVMLSAPDTTSEFRSLCWNIGCVILISSGMLMLAFILFLSCLWAAQLFG